MELLSLLKCYIRKFFKLLLANLELIRICNQSRPVLLTYVSVSHRITCIVVFKIHIASFACEYLRVSLVLTQ